MAHVDAERLRRAFRKALLVTLTSPGAIGLACGQMAPGPTVRDADGSGGDAGRDAEEGDTRAAFDASIRDTGIDTGTLCETLLVCTRPFWDGGSRTVTHACTPNPGAMPFCTELCIDAGMFLGPYCSTAPGGSALDCCYTAGGRRPEGLVIAGTPAGPPLGAFFASLAALEAASVPAFQHLRDELRAHGAPAALADRADEAIDDERLHTKMTTALAKRFGGAPTAPVVSPLSVRPLSEVAIENAVEGCVRETFGALVAIYQAERAEDRAVRRAMKRIAEDESRHAELAWDVASFCDERLGEGERAAVRAAMRDALETLRDEIDRPVHDDVCRVAGVPSREDARRLLLCLEDAVVDA